MSTPASASASHHQLLKDPLLKFFGGAMLFVPQVIVFRVLQIPAQFI